MAKKNVSFFDKHIEKVFLGLCAAGAVAAAVTSFGGSRFGEDGKGPSDLSMQISEATEKAKRVLTLSPTEDKPTKPGESANDPLVLLRDWFGETPKGLPEIAKVSPTPPRMQALPPPLPFSADSLKADKRNLARLVTPTIPVVVSGRSTLNFPENKPLLGSSEEVSVDLINPNASTVSWVSVGAQLDLVQQEANFIAERYATPAYLTIVKVHLQRKDEGDTARGWQDVNTYLPYTTIPRPVSADGRPDLSALQKARRVFDSESSQVCRPELPGRIGGDKMALVPLPFIDESPKPSTDDVLKPETEDVRASRLVSKWTKLARDAMNGKGGFRQPDLDAALIMARAAVAMNGAKEKDAAAAKQVHDDIMSKLPKARKAWASSSVRSPDRMMPIVAHDLTGLPGHTYTYRLRYEVLNVYAGNEAALVNPGDAARVTLFSDWSPESRPVEIPSDIYYYLTKADKATGKATVLVLRKSARGIDKQEYAVRPGDKIGRKEPQGRKLDFATGATCVDVDFDRVVDGKKDVALVYADPTDGTLYERLLSKDSQDKVLKKLLEFKPPAPGK
ncbi:MAG: hypothetical protein HZA51_08530 [Planctomycetes bacterium]|nr:hypothetical protein [Planctomycetota bacterium]